VNKSCQDLASISPPPSVSEELTKLKKDLDEKIPSKKLGRNVIIAT
jgi:hypothetical protein